MRKIIALDKQLILLMNYNGCKWTSKFLYVFSEYSIWFILLTNNSIMSWRVCTGIARHKIIYVLRFLPLVILSDQLISDLLKPLVRRLKRSHNSFTETLSHFLHYDGYCYMAMNRI